MTEISNKLAGSGDACPNCGAAMSQDQHYCLNCGHRRGDPRLPFMDAVVFMEAMSQPSPGAAGGPPPPPAETRSRFSPSSTLIAGVATLILAVGVGVLIGRSGDHGSNAAAQGPSVIRVENGGGGGEEAASTSGEGAKKKKSSKGGKKSKNAKSKTKSKASPQQAKKAEAKAETGDSGTSKAVEEVIKPENGVKIAPPEQELGGSCEEGTAGCENGKFEGNFFGE